MDPNPPHSNPFLGLSQDQNQNQNQNQNQKGQKQLNPFSSAFSPNPHPDNPTSTNPNLSWTAHQSTSSFSNPVKSNPASNQKPPSIFGSNGGPPEAGSSRATHFKPHLPSTSTRMTTQPFSNKTAVFNKPMNQSDQQPFGSAFGGTEGATSADGSSSHLDKRQELQQRLKKAKGEANNSFEASRSGQQLVPTFFSNPNSLISRSQPQPSANAFSPFQSDSQPSSAFGGNSSRSTSAFAFGQTKSSEPNQSNSAFGNHTSDAPAVSSSPVQSLPSSPAPNAPRLDSNVNQSSPAASVSSPAPASSAFNSFLRKSNSSNQAGPQGSFRSDGNVDDQSEDEDEIRKKRFEGMEKVGERFVQIKAVRAALRDKYQKSGILPDPDRAQDLSKAQSVVGTCLEMCPEFERVEREYQKEADQLEIFPNSNVVNPLLAVKIYRRPAAGREIALPEDIRPPIVLKKTLDYLFHRLLPSSPENPMFGNVQGFLWNRTRAIRQDFIVQSKREEITIECHERIARMHILYLHWKGGKIPKSNDGGDGREWSEQQELEQLRKTLRSLIEFYDDYRLSTGRSSVNEAEFRSYNLLLHIQDPETLREVELLPNPIFLSPSVQSALRIRSLAQRSNNLEKRGQPKNTGSSLNFWTRFFHELKRPQVNYLLACLAENVFPSVRTGAVKALASAYIQRYKPPNVEWFQKALGTDSKEETMKLMRIWKIQVDPEGFVNIRKGVTISEEKPISPPFSSEIVEVKRSNFTLQDIVDGRASGAAPLIQLDDSQGTTISKDAQAQIEALREIMESSSPSLDPRWLPQIQSQGKIDALAPPTAAPSSIRKLGSTSSQAATQYLSNSLKPSSIEEPPSESPTQPQSALTASSKPSSVSALPASSVFASAFKPSAPSPLALPPQVASPSPSPAASPASATSAPFFPAQKVFGQKEATASSNLQRATFAFGGPPKPSVFSSSSAFSPPAQPQRQAQMPLASPSTIVPSIKPSSLAQPVVSSEHSNQDDSQISDDTSQILLKSQARKRAVSTSKSQAMVDAAALAAQAVKDRAREMEAAARREEEEQEARREELLAQQTHDKDRFVSDQSSALMDRLTQEYLDVQLPKVARKAMSTEWFKRTSVGRAFRRWSFVLNLRREDARQKARLEDIKEKLRVSQTRNARGSRPSLLSGDVRHRRHQDQLAASLRTSLRSSISSSRRSESLVPQVQDDQLEEGGLFEAAHQANVNLWDFGTFHSAIFLQFAHLAEQVRPGSLSRWVVALSTSPPAGEEMEQPATTWVREKFALNPGEEFGPVQEVVDGASLQVIDASTILREDQASLNTQVGLVAFECSPLLGHASSQDVLLSLWKSDSQRLSSLATSKSIRKSEFLPRLLVIFWSNDYAVQSLSSDPSTRRKQIYSRLGLSATRSAWADVALLELGDQDPQLSFENTIRNLLPSIQWNTAIRSWSLEDLILPMKDPWTELVSTVQDGMNRLSDATRSPSITVQRAEAQLAVRTLSNLVELANDLLYYVVDLSDTILASVGELEIPPVTYHADDNLNLNDAFYASALSQLTDEIVSDQPELHLIRVTLIEAQSAGTPFPLAAYLLRLLHHSLHHLEQSWLSIREGGDEDLPLHVETLKSRASQILESTSATARTIWLEHAKTQAKGNGAVAKAHGTTPSKRGIKQKVVNGSSPISSPPSKKPRSAAPAVDEQDSRLDTGPLAALKALISSSKEILEGSKAN